MRDRYPALAMNDQMIPWWWTQFGAAEMTAVCEAVRNGRINQGPRCRELEDRLAEFLQVDHVILTTSGSAALLLAMMACGVGPGDEVIIPAITFVATAHAPLLLGARVRLIDVRADRPIMDVDLLERVMTTATRVIVPVHLNGAGCDVDAIRDLAASRNISIVEDAAQAFASRSARGLLGARGNVGAFSMSLTKMISTGEGGFLATRDADLAEKLRRLRNQGVANIADNVFSSFGFNLRFNDLQASMGLAQLDRLAQKVQSARQTYKYYRERLGGLQYLRMLDCDLATGETPLWSQVLCAEREKVIALLGERGIQARPFHPCLSESRHLGVQGHFPNARAFAAAGLTLPSGPNQSEDNLSRTVDALHAIAPAIRADIETEFRSLRRHGRVARATSGV